MQDSQEFIEDIFLSYKRILEKFKILNIKTKNGKEITNIDLRQAVLIMLKKHPTCRWRCKKINSKYYYISHEGYLWLMYVYFQNNKKQIDADIDFFETRIKEYEKLLKIKSNFSDPNYCKLILLDNDILVGFISIFPTDGEERTDLTFERLFKKLYTDEEEIMRKTNSMYQYYPPEKEKEYGVIGIKISLISSGFRYTYNKLVRDKIPGNIDNETGRKRIK